MTAKPLFGAGSAPKKAATGTTPVPPRVAVSQPVENSAAARATVPVQPVGAQQHPARQPAPPAGQPLQVQPVQLQHPVSPQQPVPPQQPVLPQPPAQLQHRVPPQQPVPPQQLAPQQGVQPQQPVQFQSAQPAAPAAQHPAVNSALPQAGFAAQPAPQPAVGQPAAGGTGTIADRRQKRVRTLKGAMIVLPGQMMSSYACKVRNQSRGGAMVLVANPNVLPDEFYLIWDSDPSKKIPCRAAWRGIDRMGIAFVDRLSVE